MTTPLTHTDYSGCFPFYIAKKADWDAEGVAADGGIVSGFKLASLTKLYWRAKSVLVTAALSYDAPAIYIPGGSDKGTVTGSRRIICPSNGTTSDPPPQRTVPNTNGWPVSVVAAPNGTITCEGVGGGSGTYSNDVGFSLYCATGQPLFTGRFVAVDEARLYYFFSTFVLGGLTGASGIGLELASNGGLTNSGASLLVTIDGIAAAAPLPLYVPSDTDYTYPGAFSGSVTLNFDDFWD